MKAVLQQVRALASTLGVAAVLLALLSLLFASCASVPRGLCNPDPSEGTVGSICGFKNPEDIEAIPSAGILLVSNMRHCKSGGKLLAMPLEQDKGKAARTWQLWPPETKTDAEVADPAGHPDCRKPPDPFSPHGIASTGTDVPGIVRVAAVVHDTREAIELYDLAGIGDEATLVWRGCIPLPAGMTANDVRFAPDGEIVATFYQPVMKGLKGTYYTLASTLGVKTGHVIAWKEGRDWRDVKGTEVAGPNGLVVRDGSVIFSASGTGEVCSVPLASMTDGENLKCTKICGHPDNLTLSPRGTILAATHTDAFALLICRLSQPPCTNGSQTPEIGQPPCRSGWSIFEIDPATLKVTPLLHHDGIAVGAVSSVAEHKGRFYFGAIFDDRIGVWEPENAR